ncbi:MAG: CDP-alcohol phosphatidyltransferase family protein, partial [Clostridiales bacterium]|nr:CDP-alcohol phosphatidyltransferase family protein [Clostridiales bacterium]
MNLPNKLTILRIFMVPPTMLFIIFDFGLGDIAKIIAAALFAIASLTDMLDGKIARKYG